MSEAKSEIPGGYQLKFLSLGNNACVIQASRNTSGIPRKLVGLRKKKTHYVLVSVTLCGKNSADLVCDHSNLFQM